MSQTRSNSPTFSQDEFPTRGDVLHHPLDPCGVARPQHGIVESEDEGDARMQPDRQTAGRNLIAGEPRHHEALLAAQLRPDHDLQMRESLVVDLNRRPGAVVFECSHDVDLLGPRAHTTHLKLLEHRAGRQLRTD